jgi:hypothetical protein
VSTPKRGIFTANMSVDALIVNNASTFSDKRIQDVDAPTSDTNAATKKYVDDKDVGTITYVNTTESAIMTYLDAKDVATPNYVDTQSIH